MKLLPIWVRPDTLPAFNDAESSTALEQTYKVYKAMNELITEYNAFAESVNKQIIDFVAKYNGDIEIFTTSLRQEFQDFIDVVDVKISSMTESVTNSVLENVNTYVNSAEFAEKVLNILNATISEINTEITTIKSTLNTINADLNTIKTNYLSKETADTIYATLESLTNLASSHEQLNSKVLSLESEITTIKSTHLTKESAESTYAKKSDLGDYTPLSTTSELASSVAILQNKIAELEASQPVVYAGEYEENVSGYKVSVYASVNNMMESHAQTIQYSTDEGATWTTLTGITSSNPAVIENVEKIRFKHDSYSVITSSTETGVEGPSSSGGGQATTDIEITADTTIYVYAETMM